MKMRKSGAASNLERADVLDDGEQEALIDSMRRDANRQISNARKYFHYALLIVSVLMMSCLVYTTIHPFEMEHQAHFEGKVPHIAFQFYYFASAICFFFSSLVAKRGHHTTPTEIKVAGILLAVTVSLIWVVVFAMHSVTVPQLYWLPLANPAGILLALYVDRDAEYLLRDIEILEGMKYNHKNI